MDENGATADAELQAPAQSRHRVKYLGAVGLLVALLVVAIFGWTERASAKGDATELKREVADLQSAKSALTGQLQECSNAIDAAAEAFMAPATAAETSRNSRRFLVRVIRLLYCRTMVVS
ncbi:MAG: hypothetical protein ACXVA6_17650 [Isosphaeraceae bacterium]